MPASPHCPSPSSHDQFPDIELDHHLSDECTTIDFDSSTKVPTGQFLIRKEHPYFMFPIRFLGQYYFLLRSIPILISFEFQGRSIRDSDGNTPSCTADKECLEGQWHLAKCRPSFACKPHCSQSKSQTDQCSLCTLHNHIPAVHEMKST